MQVRTSARAGSFRRKEKLEDYMDAARAEAAQPKTEVEADPGEV